MEKETEFSISNYIKEYVPMVLATEGALIRLALEMPEQADAIRQAVTVNEEHSLEGLADSLERYPEFSSLYREEFAYITSTL